MHPDRIHLLDRLWACQDEKGYISDQDIHQLAKALDAPYAEIDGVASFYHFFHRKPTGKFQVYLNNSILSEHAGYWDVRRAFEAATHTKWGETSAYGTISLMDTPCIGLSDREPSALINFQPFTNLTPAKVRSIVSELKAGTPVEELADPVEEYIRFKPEEDHCVFFREYTMGKIIKDLGQLTPDEVMRQIDASELSGRGGAFFPTAAKWMSALQFPGPRYVVCNADEGEPGTFKDRALMNLYPGLLLEGMAVAAYAIQATEGIIYLRAEYRWLLPKLEKAIQDLEAMGLLGDSIPAKEPFSFRIRIQLGAGAYVCGEETALLESMEGKRGEPRNKTFFPTEKGFLGQPTIVNNVETLCGAARVIELGAHHIRSLGTPASSGTKLLSVGGDCLRPGIYEVEWGMTVSELMALCGAKDPYMIQLSGPSGQCINRYELMRRICAEDLLCGGSVMIFNRHRDILHIIQNFNAFFRHESCGVCTPCRAGNFIFTRKLEKLQHCLGRPEDLVQIRQWSKLMKQASRCGLGKTASNPISYALEKFPDYFNELVNRKSQACGGVDIERAVSDYYEAGKTN
jgi:[NiFe] hydrogenase diaphorase moiety large subunit